MALKKIDLDVVNSFNKGTMMEVLGIECIEIGDDYLKAKMPVNKKTHQPMGLLHGGASAALIESIGSMGSTLILDLNKEAPVGLEINANHVGGVKDGYVIATGRIVHEGSKTHVWQVDIVEENTDKLICTGRLTIMILQKK
jgi:1,4-dihydroxy-2-naphthoyl-CoA hydrolase